MTKNPRVIAHRVVDCLRVFSFRVWNSIHKQGKWFCITMYISWLFHLVLRVFFWSDKAGLPPTCMYIYNAPQKRKIYLQKKKLSCALRWWWLDVLSFKETLLTMSSEASAEWATNASGEGGCLFLGRNCKIGKKSVNGVFSVRGLTFSLFIRNTTDNVEPNQCWLSHPCCTWRGLVGSQVLLWIKDSTFELACEKKP